MSAPHVLRPVLVAAPLPEDGARPPAAERLALQRRAAHQALRASARRSGLELGPLVHDERGAPRLADGGHVSLSHARGLSAAVVSPAPVGIDVELVEQRSTSVVPAVTSRDELELLGGFTWWSFLRVWTAKEAVLKKAGCGLAELSRCRLLAVPADDLLVLSHRGAEHLVRQAFHGRHIASLAADDAQDAAVEWATEDLERASCDAKDGA